jgi:hypothetical protein
MKQNNYTAKLKKKEEETSHHAAHRHFGIIETNIRWWKKKGATEHSTEDDAL